MPRLRDNAAKKAQRQEADRKDKVRLALIKMDMALLKVDELARHYLEAIDNRIRVIRDTTDKELLKMKWSDFLALKIDKFTEYQGSGNSQVIPRAPRSRSVSQKSGERIRYRQRTRVQSVDRHKMDEYPTLSFLRWPRAGESVLSKAGSPLAVPKPLEKRCANVQIPTSKGVITVKPQKMHQVKREVLMALDPNTLAQVKTLTANLGEIVNIASKMKKL